MKKSLLIISIILALTFNNLFAQENTSGNAIIFANGDTLSSPQIVKSKKQTNQDQIVYIDGQNQKLKLSASKIKAYYLNNESFHSEEIKGDNLYKLVSYEVGGYISFGLSYTSNGDMNFYVKKDEVVIALEKYQYDLKSFFSTYLEDFAQFNETYKVKISYDFKTLAEMISAYNVYKFPEKYVFERYKKKEMVKFGIIASGGVLNTNLSGYYEDVLIGGSFSFGMDLESWYSRYLGIHVPLSYNIGKASSSNSSINLSTLNFEPYLTYRSTPKKKISFEFGAGIGLMYSFNSFLDCSLLNVSDQNKVKLKNIGFGPNFSLIANLQSRLKAQLMFAHYQIQSNNLKLSSPEDTTVKAGTNNLRFMIAYYF